MKYEAIFDCSREKHLYAIYFKYSRVYSDTKKADEKIENLSLEEFLEIFPFAEVSDKDIKDFKKIKVKEFPLAYFKKSVSREKEEKDRFWHCKKNDIDNLKNTSSIFTSDKEFKDYIASLIPGSFGLRYKFELKSPYYSRDDEEFYIIDNPVLKDKVWKAPMVKGSAWKGMLLKAASRKLEDYIENGETQKAVEHFQSALRIFGTGSDDFRKVVESAEKYMKNEDKDEEQFQLELARYALNELGINLEFSFNGKSIKSQIWEHVQEQGESFNVKKGRGIFYPTYFNRLSLEIINPHKRETKAGTQPIYFEVVPEGTEGIFQFMYIPHDAISLPMKVMKKQAEVDRIFLEGLITDVLEESGIGSKTKYGWGRANIKKDSILYYFNMGGEQGE